MLVRRWLATAVYSSIWVIAVLSGCGDDDSTTREAASADDASVDAARGLDAGDGSTFDANTYVPPDDTLPALPPTDIDSGAPPGSLFFARKNPTIYINDAPDSVFTDAYMYALAANDDVKLVGVISSGVDCKCAAGDNIDSSPRRRQWIGAARDAGFQNVPDDTVGGFAVPMTRPASGLIQDTLRAPSAGSQLIVDQAKLASRDVPLVIVSGGPIATLANAYLQEPSITQTVVVSWLAGSLTKDGLLDLANGWVTDPWAAEIVLRNFRTFIYPVGLDTPLVSKCRIASDIPPSALKDLLLGAGYFLMGHDADGPPAVTINYPAYMKRYLRVALSQPTGLANLVNPTGNIWVLLEGDQVAGGEEFFRELRKAYKVPGDASPFASDAGCTP